MCQKRQRRCADLLALRVSADREWYSAEDLHAVRVAWGRLGGRTTLHRYGRDHFRQLRRRRDAEC